MLSRSCTRSVIRSPPTVRTRCMPVCSYSVRSFDRTTVARVMTSITRATAHLLGDVGRGLAAAPVLDGDCHHVGAQAAEDLLEILDGEPLRGVRSALLVVLVHLISP